MILLDSNILLRWVSPNDPANPIVRAAIQSLFSQFNILCIVPQNLYEFWAVATRPVGGNGLGLSAAECHVELSNIKNFFWLLPDLPPLYDEWETIVQSYSCHGRISFDARLVAAMRTHGISVLLTLNGSDFSRFPGLTLLDPAQIVASSVVP